MAKAPRRHRVDTAAGAVAVMKAAARQIEPPEGCELRDQDLPFWRAVIDARAKEEWTDADLYSAASLARAMADSEWIAREEAVAATVLETARLLGLQDKLQRRIITLRRSLGLDARAGRRQTEDIAGRRAKAKEIEADNPLAGDDLLGGRRAALN